MNEIGFIIILEIVVSETCKTENEYVVEKKKKSTK
jgi:hypothetical protein